MGFNHLDFSPATCPRGQLYDAYEDMRRIAGNLETENCLQAQRIHKLEEWMRAQVEGSLEYHRCLLGECTPVWNHQLGRYAHVEPCRLAAAEQLLAATMRHPLHYGIGGDGDYIGQGFAAEAAAAVQAEEGEEEEEEGEEGAGETRS
jgi:hypothetical protein